MKVMLIRPPKYIWPFLNYQDNYMTPQNIACLGAYLRENDVEVKLVDCMADKIGWNSLRKLMEKEQPDVVGSGDGETLYAHENLRTFKIAKEVNKNITTIVGGAHFSNMIKESLKNNYLDFIGIGEGEITLLELVKNLENKKDFKKINGLAFRKGKNIITTKPRELIKNLDDLPIPAYDLLPMKKYGNSKYLFTGGTTIHHSRGCVGNCDFCACWVQMAKRIKNKKYPCWRTKSVDKTIKEIEILTRKYKRKYLVFTDDTWNVDPKWNEEFSDAVISNGLKFNAYTFMRADFILRDEKLGIFKKQVDAGLRHMCIGVERADDTDLKNLSKGKYSNNLSKQVFDIINKKYPKVFTNATFVVGLRNDTRESLIKITEFAKNLKADYPAFHPVTPVPGTKTWKDAKKGGWLEVKDFRKYDWMTPIIPTETLSRKEFEKILLNMNKKIITPKKILKGLFNRDGYRRGMYIWLLLVASRVSLSSIFEKFKKYKSKEEEKKLSPFFGLVEPKWYND